MLEYSIDLFGEEDLRISLLEVPEHIRQAVGDKIETLTEELYAKVLDNVNGRLLQRKTGQLASSIQKEVDIGGDVMEGWVGPVPANPKAWVQEYGGKGDYTIVPVNKNWLHFFWEKKGDWVFAKEVNHPPLEARRYLRQALVEMEDRVDHEIFWAVNEDLKSLWRI